MATHFNSELPRSFALCHLLARYPTRLGDSPGVDIGSQGEANSDSQLYYIEKSWQDQRTG